MTAVVQIIITEGVALALALIVITAAIAGPGKHHEQHTHNERNNEHRRVPSRVDFGKHKQEDETANVVNLQRKDECFGLCCFIESISRSAPIHSTFFHFNQCSHVMHDTYTISSHIHYTSITTHTHTYTHTHTPFPRKYYSPLLCLPLQ